eukprot:Awhi_evm2s4987
MCSPSSINSIIGKCQRECYETKKKSFLQLQAETKTTISTSQALHSSPLTIDNSNPNTIKNAELFVKKLPPLEEPADLNLDAFPEFFDKNTYNARIPVSFNNLPSNVKDLDIAVTKNKALTGTCATTA